MGVWKDRVVGELTGDPTQILTPRWGKAVIPSLKIPNA